jgi:methylglutaconyl-CoA hydratase
MMGTISLSPAPGILTVTLDRPEVRNVFNETMIAELASVFGDVGPDTRVIILKGNGTAFCAGADVNWMRDSIHRSEADNARDAATMEAMFRAIDECPSPVIGRVHGFALGGAVGLVAACDVVVAAETARFGFTEVSLGIIPAVISPFALDKIGSKNARRYFVTGELFNAPRAQEMGLVHEVVAEDSLDSTVNEIVESILKNGPQAVAAAKSLVREVGAMTRDQAREHTIATIARIRTSAEGQEGLGAFLEKRKPKWME